jgi:cysteine desulfurase
MTPEPCIYLDNAASSPVDARVREAMLPWLGEHCGNASSLHARGREARAAVERARIHVALLAGAQPSEVLFTSGGTEADNMALLTFLAAPTGHIVTSRAEHPAVLACCDLLEGRGWDVTRLDVLADGSVSAEAVMEAMRDDTALVSLMHVNNETGGITDIDAIARIVHDRGARLHTDSVQSYGKLPLDVDARNIAYAAVSAHKLHGPKGTGALFLRRGVPALPMLLGGAQERGMRAGTENVAAIVGFGEAARIALEDGAERMRIWHLLRAEFTGLLRAGLPACILNGDADRVVPSIVSVTLPFEAYPLSGDMLVPRLDLAGLAVSGGSACTSGSAKVSHVMRAIGHDDASARASVRISFGAATTMSDVRAASELLVRTVQDMVSEEKGGRARSATP